MQIPLLLVLLLTSLVLERHGLAADIDFKGVPFGASEREFMDAHPSFRCREIEAKWSTIGDRACSLLGLPKRSSDDPKVPEGTFAGVPANITAYFYADRLASVHVAIFSSHFRNALDALITRYGKPDNLKEHEVTNRMGATFQNVTATWTHGDVILTGDKYGSQVTRGRISYKTKWGAEEFAQRKKKRDKKGAGDL